MDDSDWAANGFFSPSKAKLAQAQARDWSFVDAWLSKKYISTRLPSFERNHDTLQALLALIAVNEAADERRLVVDRLEKLALQHYSRRQQQHKTDDTLYHDISSNLDQAGHAAVDTLARASLLLSSPVQNGASELVTSAIALQMHAFESQQAEQEAMSEYKALTIEHDRLINLLADLKDDSFRAPESLLEETAQWSKGVKHLRAKIGEYDERLPATRPAVQQSIQELLEDSKRMKLEIVDRQAQLLRVDRDLEALQNYSSHMAEEQINHMKQELHRLQGARHELLQHKTDL